MIVLYCKTRKIFLFNTEPFTRLSILFSVFSAELLRTGVESADVEVIPMSSRAKDLYLNLVKKAEKEIIIMFPTTNAFIRQNNIGVIHFSEEAAKERNVKVRILMPSDKSTEDVVRQLKENYAECIDIRYIDKMEIRNHY
jgi:phosphatidylserine/phosphatidylglycerophosphate/cardiolipin synthase-like enzyme